MSKLTIGCISYYVDTLKPEERATHVKHNNNNKAIYGNTESMKTSAQKLLTLTVSTTSGCFQGRRDIQLVCCDAAKLWCPEQV